MFERSLLFLLFLPLFGFSQDVLLDNETAVLDFLTEEGQRLTIYKDLEETYLVCRFESEDRLEFEFPKHKTNAWGKFLFSNYYRGGGIENLAMDLNYLYFIFNNSKYVVYEIFRAENNYSEYGLKVIDLDSEIIKNFKARRETVKGSLGALRDNEKIKKGDELF